MVVLGHHVSWLQWLGYTVALTGLGAYKFVFIYQLWRGLYLSKSMLGFTVD